MVVHGRARVSEVAQFVLERRQHANTFGRWRATDLRAVLLHEAGLHRVHGCAGDEPSFVPGVGEARQLHREVVAAHALSTCRVVTVGPGTTAPWPSVTRPLTLALLMESWAATGSAWHTSHVLTQLPTQEMHQVVKVAGPGIAAKPPVASRPAP